MERGIFWMIINKCRAVQSRLTIYLHGELPPGARRRVAQHLDRCPNCRVEYARRRELTHKLQRTLPRIGQAQSGQLARIWTAVRAEITDAPPSPQVHFRLRYGLIALVLVAGLLTPWALSRDSGRSVPPQDAVTTQSMFIALATNFPENTVPLNVSTVMQRRTATAVVRTSSRFTPEAALTPAPGVRP